MKRTSGLNLGLGALLLGLGLTVGTRGLALLRHPARASAQREERFFSWARREPRAAELLRQVDAMLAPGEPVVLAVVQAEQSDLKWWRTMASYHLVDRRVLDVVTRNERDTAPPEAALVLITPERELRLLRHGYPAGAP